jgi:hypothetical protein
MSPVDCLHHLAFAAILPNFKQKQPEARAEWAHGALISIAIESSDQGNRI